jgi:uncharacterized protein YjbI with pentapeptide repeats
MAKGSHVCLVNMNDGRPCGRTLYDDSHCIFHCRDIAGKASDFIRHFQQEFERQKEIEPFFDFTGFVFIPTVSFSAAIFDKPAYFGEACLVGVNFSDVVLHKAIFQEANLENAIFSNAQLSESNFQGAKMSRANFEKADLQGADLQGSQIEKAYFQQANLQGTDFWGANLAGTNFKKADFWGANLQKANLAHAVLINANLQGTILVDANLEEAILKHANLQGANLSSARLVKANLVEADLQGANLQNANMEECNLQSADLWEIDLQKANLKKANLQEVKLQGANLQGAILHQAILFKSNLQKADLWGAALQGANLQEIKLNEANLQKASIFGVNLQGSSLQMANLCEANLQESDLWGADFREADLTRINLTKANLEATDFQGANLMGANLQNANIKKTDFWHANLQGVDFHGTAISETNFQDADLTGANFIEAHLHQVDFSNAKLTGILINQDLTSMIPQEIRQQYINSWYITRHYDHDSLKVFEFPPEFVQAGISLLFFLSEIFEEKGKKQVRLKVELDHLLVTMVIETATEQKQAIEELLVTYGKILARKLSPDVFFSDKLKVQHFLNIIDSAALSVKKNWRIMELSRQIQEGQIESEAKHFEWLKFQLGYLLMNQSTENQKILSITNSLIKIFQNYINSIMPLNEKINEELSFLSQKLNTEDPDTNDIDIVESSLLGIKSKAANRFSEIKDIFRKFNFSTSPWEKKISALVEKVSKL